MDIKDFILITGGILIALVVGHGFWIAWRAKKEPLRLDIVPDLIPDDVDEIERLRGELPNGGARVVRKRRAAHEQENLELDLAAPLLMEPATQAQPEEFEEPEAPIAKRPDMSQPKKLRPKVHQAPPRQNIDKNDEPLLDGVGTGEAAELTTRSHVREVQINPQPIVTETPTAQRVKQKESNGRARAKSKRDESTTSPTAEAGTVRELLIVNILAPKGERFDGEGLVNALRNQGLRYGDMNIFHRVDAATKAKLYSVANAVEPGTFDLSDLASMRSPGMTFFLQLPGPDDASGVFEDMLAAARNVALELGGELRDEDLSVLTGQTMEHMRQRIADFARRRLSKRA